MLLELWDAALLLLSARLSFIVLLRDFGGKIKTPGEHLLEIFTSSIRDLENHENLTQTQTQTATQTLTQTLTLSLTRTQRHSKQFKRKSNYR